MTALTLPPPLGGSAGTAGDVAAVSMAVAAGAHLAAFPAHRGQGLAVGGFFAAVAVIQLVAATTVVHGSGARLRAAVVAGNGGLIALWAWSRTAGVPVGAHAGLPEPVGTLDLTAVAAQVVAVGAALFLARRGRARLVRSPALVALALTVGVGGALLVPDAHAARHHGPARPSSQPDHHADAVERSRAADVGHAPGPSGESHPRAPSAPNI